MGVYLHSGYMNMNYRCQSTIFSRVQDACIIYFLFCAYFSCFHVSNFKTQNIKSVLVLSAYIFASVLFKAKSYG